MSLYLLWVSLHVPLPIMGVPNSLQVTFYIFLCIPLPIMGYYGPIPLPILGVPNPFKCVRLSIMGVPNPFKCVRSSIMGVKPLPIIGNLLPI